MVLWTRERLFLLLLLARTAALLWAVSRGLVQVLGFLRVIKSTAIKAIRPQYHVLRIYNIVIGLSCLNAGQEGLSKKLSVFT